jgi:hypothetical protein
MMKPTHTFYLHHLDLACTTPIFTSRITILTASPTSDTRTPRSCAFIPLYTHVYLSPHRITSHHMTIIHWALHIFFGHQKYRDSNESSANLSDLALHCVRGLAGMGWAFFCFFCTHTH